MASSVAYTNDYTEPYVYSENAQTVPKGDTVPKVIEMPAKNPKVNCALVLAIIALVLSIICLAILTWLMVGMNDRGNESSSNPQVDLNPGQATTQMTENPHQSRPTQTPPIQSTSGSAVYIRWGSTMCPTNASLIYKGITGGKLYSHAGSGSNYLCLPEVPEYDFYQAGQSLARALIYTAEYRFEGFSQFEDKNFHDAPCAVCHAKNRVSMLMIPAKMTCPDDSWTNEYHGYLMAERYANPGTEFVCVDRDIEIRPGTIGDQDGVQFFPVEGRCNTGNLPCAPYIDGAELTCVVCTK